MTTCKYVYCESTTDPSTIYINVALGNRSLQASITKRELQDPTFDYLAHIATQFETKAYHRQIEQMKQELTK